MVTTAPGVADWPTGGGNGKRTGSNSVSIRPPLTTAWKFTECGWIQGGVVCSQNVAVFGDRDGMVFGVDLGDGGKLWKYDLGGMITGTAVIEGPRVYIGSSKAAVCLDLTTGNMIWKRRESMWKKSWFKREITDIFASNNCAFSAGAMILICDYGLTSFDAEDGKTTIYKVPGNDPLPNTGPCMDESYVYCPFEREILRFTLGSAEYKTIQLSKKLTSGPACGEGLVFFGTNHWTLDAMDPYSGAVVWSFQMEDKGIYVESRPAVHNGRVFVGGCDGNLYAVDARSGAEIWRLHLTDGTIESSPLVCGETLFILCDKGFHAVDTNDGKLLWRHDDSINPAGCSPALAGNSIIVGWDALYCFAPGE